MKKKLVFALLMGIFSTGIISLALIKVNTDLMGWKFISIWLKSWGIAYVVVIPTILIISPIVEKIVNKLIKE
jgi:hypothetical protein